MNTASLARQATKLLFLCIVAWTPVCAEEALLSIPVDELTATSTPAAAAADFQLNGILISKNSRTALVNDHVLREGDQVGNAKILEIKEGVVRILVDSQLLDLRVGTSTAINGTSVTSVSSVPPTAQHRLLGSAGLQRNEREFEVQVNQGDTLSALAQRYLGNEVTLNQMMLALFDENPHAFAGNINRLRAGVTLRLPASKALHHRTATSAATEVLRQREVWRDTRMEQLAPVMLATAATPETYGPVQDNDTLSSIAAHKLSRNATLNQIMIAIYQANPDAFDENIHVLKEGVYLQIPDLQQIHRHAPDYATAEVVRHTNAWQIRSTRQARQSAAQPSIAANSYTSLTSQLQTLHQNSLRY